MLTLWKIKEFGSMNASAEYLCIYFALILETNNVSADTLPKYYRRQNSGGRTLLTFRQHTSNGNNASADTLPTYFRNPSDVLALEAHWPTLYRPITNNYNALAYILLTNYRHPSYSPTNSVFVKTLPTY